MPDRTPLIYVDANVYLDLITRNTDPHKDTGDPRWQSAKALFEAVERQAVRLASSPLIEAEVLCNSTTQRRQTTSDNVTRSLRSWFQSPNTIWVDVDRGIAREAARMANDYGHLRPGDKRMSAADAMHLAAAVRAQCGYLMTHDEGFPIGHEIEKVKVKRPAVVWQETLFDI